MIVRTVARMSVQAVKQFYRRKLPEKCVSFSSLEGKKLFAEALSQGNMECYFKLAEQFRTQDEPAFCGLTTLVMVLNSLSVDPGRVWKGPWRWYHENMLDCCVPLQMIKEEGINFNQMMCLASCNGLDVRAQLMPENNETEEESVDKFRELVKKMVKKDDEFLVLSYSRKVLGQTGSGHFSPVGGYHSQNDLVLILDTARFKYPPHWIPLTLVCEAMRALDTSIGKPRGYMVMSRMDIPNSLVLFRIFPVFSVSLSRYMSGGFSVFLSLWRQWLSQDSSKTVTSDDKMCLEPASQCCHSESPSKKEKSCCFSETNESVLDISKEKSDMECGASDDLTRIDINNPEITNEIKICISFLIKITEHISSGESILTTCVDLKCVQDESKEHACVLQILLTDLESLPLFKSISLILQSIYHDSPEMDAALNKLGFVAEGLQTATANLCKLHCQTEECKLAKRLSHSHFLTVFLLSWPYGKKDNSTLRSLVDNFAREHKGTALDNECSTLRKQISLLMQLCNNENRPCPQV